MYKTVSWLSQQSLCQVMLVTCLLLSPVSLALAEATADAKQTAEIQKQLLQFDQYAEAGQGAAAMNVFQAVKLKHPNDPLVRSYEAKILIMQNKMLEAVPVLQATLNDHPNYPMASALLANLEFRMGKQQEAQKRLTEALTAHPKAWELLQIAGEIKIAQKDHEGSLPYWKQIANDSKNPATARMGAYTKLGLIANEQGKYKEAAAVFKLALMIKWHPSVGMAYIQALDQDKQYENLFNAIADMRKHLTGDNPQLVKLRQQFEAQIGPFEARAKQSSVVTDLAQLEKDITGGRVGTLDIYLRMSDLKMVINKETDPEKKADLERKLQLCKLLVEKGLLKESVEKKHALDYQLKLANKVEELAKGLKDPRVDEALALVRKAREGVAKKTQTQREAVLELAGKGWMLANFRYPTIGRMGELKERNLPERYDHFSAELKKSLKDFYTPLADKREKLALEAATKAFIESPTDKALKTKVARLLTQRVAQIDVSQKKEQRLEVIPARIWVEPLKHAYALDISKEANVERELADEIKRRQGLVTLEFYGRNEAILKAVDLSLAHYPDSDSLQRRAHVLYFMGRYKEAWEDMAASVAVAAWEQANDQFERGIKASYWSLEGIPAVMVLDQLATGKMRHDGLYPADKIAKMLKALHAKDWSTVAAFMLDQYPLGSEEVRLVTKLKYGPFRIKIFNAMAVIYDKTGSEEKKRELSSQIKQLQGYSFHAGAGVTKADMEKEPEAKSSDLEWALMAEPRNTVVSYKLAQHYEAIKRFDDAMLAYNIAAGGKLLTQTTGLARQAATARDRLSGPMKDIHEAVKVYQPIMNNFVKMHRQGKMNALQASEYEALLMLLLNYNGNPKALLERLADARDRMRDYEGANQSLQEVIKLQPDRKALSLARIGQNYKNLGLYDQAIKSFDAAIEAGYDAMVVYFLKGEVLTFLGRYKQSVACYDKAFEKKNDSTSLLQNRADLNQYFLHDYPKAVADIERALAIFEKQGKDYTYAVPRLRLRLSNLQATMAAERLGI